MYVRTIILVGALNPSSVVANSVSVEFKNSVEVNEIQAKFTNVASVAHNKDKIELLTHP